jgi:hypothetical protein
MKYFICVVLLFAAVGVSAKEPPELVIKSASTHVKQHHSMSAKYLLKHNNDYDKCVYTPEQLLKAGYNRLQSHGTSVI